MRWKWESKEDNLGGSYSLRISLSLSLTRPLTTSSPVVQLTFIPMVLVNALIIPIPLSICCALAASRKPHHFHRPCRSDFASNWRHLFGNRSVATWEEEL